MSAGATSSSRPAREPELATISGLTEDGRGVAAEAGRTVFVDGALPGETVRFSRIRRRRNHDEGRMESVLTPSPYRVQPRCPYFGRCGGCSLQHLAPAQQLERNQERLLETLARLGGVEPAQVLGPLTGPVWRYRRRARLGVRYVRGKGRVLVGFRERFNSYVTEMDSCEVLAAPAGELVGPLARLIDGLTVSERLPQVEIAVADNHTALVFRILDPLQPGDLEQLRAFAEQHQVVVYLQPGGVDTVQAIDLPAPELSYRLAEFDVEITFRPTDFVQVNGELNGRMVARAVELLVLEGDDRVLDLYCGLGNFTLPLARRAGSVTGVDADAGLIARARQNAARNGIENVGFHLADLAAEAADAPWLQGPYDAVMLDPPRAGAASVIPHLRGAGASRIVYVSCHPDSLARDAGELVNSHGYRLRAAGVLDMFPHTAHTESMALFTA